MTLQGLNFIAKKLIAADIPYCFGAWSKDISYPYFVGEYSDNGSVNEDGESESSFILTGTTVESRNSLEKNKNKIHQIFPDSGITEILPNGIAIAVMYDGAMMIPTNSDTIKRIQINLKIKEWSVF